MFSEPRETQGEASVSALSFLLMLRAIVFAYRPRHNLVARKCLAKNGEAVEFVPHGEA